MRVVLDANIYVSALIRPKGPPGKILQRFVTHHAFELIVSNPILSEVKRALAYPRVRRYINATDSELELWVTSVELLADIVEERRFKPPVCRDPEDDKYLGAAIEGRADLVVSGDQDLLILKSYRDISIITPAEFLEML